MPYASYHRRLEQAANNIRYSPVGLRVLPPAQAYVRFTQRIPTPAERDLHLRHAGGDPAKMEPFHQDYAQCVCHTWPEARR
jgi:hypothetical protein